MSDLQAGVQRVNDEAGGVLRLQVIRRSDLPGLALDALAGDAEAAELLRQAQDTAAAIEAAPRHRLMLCGSCPRGLRDRKYAVVLARPGCDDPTMALAMAICLRCGPTPGAIQAAARVALRRIWPDLRDLQVSHPEGGRA